MYTITVLHQGKTIEGTGSDLTPESINTFTMFPTSFFVVHFVATIHPRAKVSKGTNRNLDARITFEQLLALYPDPESHNAQRYRQTDGQQAAANSRSYCVAVRSAKNC